MEDSNFLYNWCFGTFERPKDVVKALSTGKHLAEAAATLFGYCYADLRSTSPEKQRDFAGEMIEEYLDQFNKGLMREDTFR